MLSIMGSFIFGFDDLPFGLFSTPWNRAGGGKAPGDGADDEAAWVVTGCFFRLSNSLRSLHQKVANLFLSSESSKLYFALKAGKRLARAPGVSLRT